MKGKRTTTQWLMAQPVPAILVSVLAGSGLWLAWLHWPAQQIMHWPTGLLLAAVLGLACIIADLSPIHVTYHTKVSLTTVAWFVLAALVPPPVAASTAGLARLTTEYVERRKRGSLPSDVITGTARWMLVPLLGSAVVHLPAAQPLTPLLTLVAAAGLMCLADVLTLPFELCPISGDAPGQVVRDTFRSAGIVELIQYNLAVVVVLASVHDFWEVLLLIVPAVAAFRGLRNLRELRSGTQHLLEALADAIDLRDPSTGGHSRRVTTLCQALLTELGIAGPDAELIVTAARVHDIGKIGVPDAILHKVDRLSESEWVVMAGHASRGADLLARYPDFARGVAIVRHHHERMDGTGYPHGLRGTEIPFGARVLAVADSYDAMTSNRPYRAGMSPDEAVAILDQDQGQQWDRRIVEAFLRVRAVGAQLALDQEARPPHPAVFAPGAGLEP